MVSPHATASKSPLRLRATASMLEHLRNEDKGTSPTVVPVLVRHKQTPDAPEKATRSFATAATILAPAGEPHVARDTVPRSSSKVALAPRLPTNTDRPTLANCS